MKKEYGDEEAFTIRISFVAYRDFESPGNRFDVLPFSEDVDEVKAFINKIGTAHGIDWAEDVQGGLKVMLMQDWTEEAAKRVFLIGDAPGHGSDINNTYYDRFKGGSPDGLKIQDLMKEFKDKDIDFNLIKLDSSLDSMIKVMKEYHDEMDSKDMTDQDPEMQKA